MTDKVANLVQPDVGLGTAASMRSDQPPVIAHVQCEVGGETDTVGVYARAVATLRRASLSGSQGELGRGAGSDRSTDRGIQ